MKRFFLKWIDYVYYRIVHGMVKIGFSERFSYHCSYFDIGLCVSSNICTVVFCLIYMIFGGLSNVSMICIGVLLTLIGSFIIIDDVDDYYEGKIYEKLDSMYKDEKYSFLKAILVFLYCISSYILFAIDVHFFLNDIP